ncbi:MAG: hypothetical protein GX042_01930 [Bacteroidales bacterium]|jgi:hypothetical protein|nr:hypothetical protein [Bacteroidales bacterium]
MRAVVRTFRTTIVEGRFISLITSLVVIGMRTLLFYRAGMPAHAFTDNSFIWSHIAHLFADPVVSFTASTVSVFLIALILSSVNSRFTLIRSRSTLPFLVPLFLFSLHPWFLVMRGDYLSLIFILLAFSPLLKSYQKSDSYLYSFRSGVLIAVASLFQLYALVLLPLWWRGELSMRGYQFRSFLSSIFGVLLIYISLFSLYFLYDDIAGFLQPFRVSATLSLPALPALTITEWIAVMLVGLFFILNMYLSIRTYSRDKVLTLSFMQFVVFLIIFLLLLQVLFWSMTLFFFTLCLALISYLNAYFFTRTVSKANIILGYVTSLLMMLLYLSHLLPGLPLLG